LKLQERVFHEKAQKNEILKLEKLSRAEAEVAVEALQHYPVLRRLEITGSRFRDVESFLLDLFKALASKSSVMELCLADNELGVKGAMFAMRKVLDKTPLLSMLDLKNNGITEEGAKMLAEALLQRRDAALTIELDGNDLGGGALILALALKFQVQVTVVHPKVQLLEETVTIEAQAEIGHKENGHKKVTFTDLCRLTSLFFFWSASRCGQQDVAWQLAAVARAFDTLQQLVKLNVSFISITDEGCQALGDGLGKLLQLTTLSLGLTGSVGPEGCRALGDGLGKLLQLTTLSLSLSHRNVGAEGCQALGDGLCKLLQLTSLSLNLDSNNVGAEGCQALGDGLCKLLQLTSLSLDLAYNNVGPGGCQALGLGKLLQLTTLKLNLGWNKVVDGGCRTLGDGLCKLLQLTSLSLDLELNGVGPEGCRALGDGLGKLLHLTSLSLVLTSNKVEPEGCRALGDGLCKLPKLTDLTLNLDYIDIYYDSKKKAEVDALWKKLRHVPNLQISNLQR